MITPSGKLLGLDLTARDRAILELLYATGCRIQEAVGLDLDAVDLDDRTVIVRGKGNKEHGPVRPTSEAGARGMAGRLRETSPTLRGDVAPALSSCVRVTTAPVTWRTPATGAPCNSRRPSLRRIPAWRKPCSLSTTTI